MSKRRIPHDKRDTQDKPNDLHVYPIGDLHTHVLTRLCWCKPRIEDPDEEDPTCSYLVIHNSADGREDYETLAHRH